VAVSGPGSNTGAAVLQVFFQAATAPADCARQLDVLAGPALVAMAGQHASGGLPWILQTKLPCLIPGRWRAASSSPRITTRFLETANAGEWKQHVAAAAH
jgi:hypothetical protein